MILEVSSTKNPKIKGLLALQKHKERRATNSFVIEGVREISLAQQGNYKISSLFICREIYQTDLDYPINLKSLEVIHVTKEVFQKITYRESTGGIVAVAQMKNLSLENLTKTAHPLYLVLEKVEKPGNIGAILRTADAAGVDGVIVCDELTDFYNPNVIRSSVGCVFTVPIAITNNEELNSWLKANNIQSVATFLTATKVHYATNLVVPTAILLGSESNGLSDFWNKYADEKVIIPMKGKIDSMNISNAAAIMTYEALRQRGI